MTKIKMAFDPHVAKHVGTDAAIILSNIEYWQELNKANNINFFDGRYWTYNSVSAFQEIFSYLTPRQIRNCLEKLESNNLIVSGNHNKKKYDRTKWYSANEYTICQEGKIHLTKLTNGVDKNVKPIPDSKQQITNTNKKHVVSNSEKNVFFSLDECTFLLQNKERVHKSRLTEETFNKLFSWYSCDIDKSGYITTNDKQLTFN